jgi:hypothetical protein
LAPLLQVLYRYVNAEVVSVAAFSKPGLGMLAAVSDPEANVDLYGAEIDRVPS